MAHQSSSFLNHSSLETTLNVDKSCISLQMDDETHSKSDSESVFPNSIITSLNNPDQITNQSTEQLLNSTEHDGIVPFTPQCTFMFILIGQYFKAFATLYLSFGIVIAVTFGIREVMVDTSTANVVWNYIGIPYCFLLVHTVILIIIAKVFVYQNPGCLEPKQSLNNYLFYLLLVLPASLSCFSVLFSLLRDSQYQYHCAVMIDILLPLFRLLFTMLAVMITSDLINNQVSPTSNTKFYLIYKFSTILIFVTCINFMIFDFVNSETHYLQAFLSQNMPNPAAIYCNSNYSNNTYVDIEKKTFLYLHVFSILYSLMTVVLLLEPLKQLFGWPRPNHIQDNQLILNESGSQNSSDRSLFIPKYLSLVIICSMILFILSSIIVILEIMANSHLDIKEHILLGVYIILILVFLICSLISQILLSLLHDSYSLKTARETPSVPIIIIWVSLCGFLLTVLRDTIDQVVISNTFGSVQSKVGIILQIENIAQSLLQAMTMDYLFQIDWNCKLPRSKLNKIYYFCIPLIAMNTGCLITDYYNMCRNDVIFTRSNDTYHKLTWDIFSSLGNPFMILYRLSGAVFIIIFINGMRCRE